MNPFIKADAHSFILPLVQGFVGQREFTVSAKSEQPDSNVAEEHTEGRMLGEKDESQSIKVDAAKRNFLLTLISRRSVKRPGLRYLRRGVDDEGNTANTSSARIDPSLFLAVSICFQTGSGALPFDGDKPICI